MCVGFGLSVHKNKNVELKFFYYIYEYFAVHGETQHNGLEWSIEYISLTMLCYAMNLYLYLYLY
jgi:hypothetical protein